MIEVPSARHGRGLRWRARYVDAAGRELSKAFDKKIDAQRWLAGVSASIVRGDHVTPKQARITVGEWSRSTTASCRATPCSRRTSPGAGKPWPYVATTEQVWALHDLVPAGMKPPILLAAHAGLRLAEAAALRPEDVDFMCGVVSPTIQWPAEPLKSETSRTPIPIPNELSVELSAAVASGEGLTIVTNNDGQPVGPWVIERAVRDARDQVEGLPDGFRFHDLRHFASRLVAAGGDVEQVEQLGLQRVGHGFDHGKDLAVVGDLGAGEGVEQFETARNRS